MEHEHRKKLYIPYNLNFDTEYFTGFGKPELKQCAVGITGFGIVAALFMLVTGNLAVLVITLMIGAAGSIMMTRKDPVTRMSVIGQIFDMVNFAKSQKTYRYIYKSKWF